MPENNWIISLESILEELIELNVGGYATTYDITMEEFIKFTLNS